MSWISDIYDHLHDDMHLPELPGMDRDRAEDIVADAFAPGSPIYYHLRHNSQVAEFLLPGLDLNFEENYNDFYGDLVGEDRTNTTEGGTEPSQGEPTVPDKEIDCDPGQDYVYPLPNEWSEDSPVVTIDDPTTSPCCHCDEGETPEDDSTPPVAEEPCDPPADAEHPEPSPGYIEPLPGEDAPPEWIMPIYPPDCSSSGMSEQVFRYMAGGDRELSAAELKGSIDEAQFDCSPHDRAIRDFSGLVDINDDCSVSKFETDTTISMMDADRNGTVSLAELRRFLAQLSGTA